MSPVGYIIAVPLGLITLSVWWVRSDDSSFRNPHRTWKLQTQSHQGGPGPAPASPGTAEASPGADYQRYGMGGDGANGGSLLGRDAVFRPVGARPDTPPEWLDAHGHESHRPPQTRPGVKPSKIADYQDAPPPADPLDAAIPQEAGYNIVADEVTKIEMGKQRVVFNGNVRMQSAQFYLTSDELVVFLEKDKTTMHQAVASGNVNVRLTNVPPERACRTQSSRAVYDPKTDILVLSGWPKIKSQSQEQIAATQETKMTIITKTGKMETQGKALTRITKSFVAEQTNGAPSASASASTSPDTTPASDRDAPPRAVPVSAAAPYHPLHPLSEPNPLLPPPPLASVEPR